MSLILCPLLMIAALSAACGALIASLCWMSSRCGPPDDDAGDTDGRGFTDGLTWPQIEGVEQ